MRRVLLSLKKSVDDSYEIAIEKGMLKKIASDLRMKRLAENYVVITDSTVNRLYAKDFISSLKREKLFLGKIVVPAGEGSKSIEQFQEVLEKMSELDANRNTAVIALGGGVVGDLGGFVAASFMRGISFVQVPTTLLAMVDSSVGGKVGIDLKLGKNLVGAFWQPKKVYIDPEVLMTLQKKHWKAGLGEAIKYGAIQERALWEFFEKHIELWQKDPNDFLYSEWAIIEEMIERCVQIKANVVMKDEKEGNLRQILNYGHTFGHVIELMSDYTVLHGEAVATGMRIAADLAVKLRYMPKQELEKHDELLNTLKIGKTKTKGLIKDFIKNMRKDKKAKGDLRVVLLGRVGRCYQQLGQYDIQVDPKIIKEILKEGKWVDDIEVDSEPKSYSSPTVTGQSWGSQDSATSTWRDSYSSSSYSSSSSNTEESEETDLQKRLREMRERAEQRRREGGSGGFLPG